MSRQITSLLVFAVILVGCSTTERFSGAIKDAKESGRALVVFNIPPPKPTYQNAEPQRVGVDFINAASQPLQLVTFDLVPHQYWGIDEPKATKAFTARGPFAPGHAYKFRGPKLHGKHHVWPKLKGGSTCQTLVGMTIRYADGKVVHVGKNNISQYLTSNVDTACGPPPGIH